MRRTYLRLHTTSLQHCYTTTTVSSTQHSNRGSFVPLGSWLHLKPTTTARGDNSRAAPGAGPKLNTVFRTERVSVWTVCRIFLYTQIQWFSRLHWIFVFNILFVWPINIIEFSPTNIEISGLLHRSITMAHSDRAVHKHKPSECSTWSSGQRTLWTQDIWNNVFYRRHISVSSPAVTQHPSDDSQWRHPLRHRHLFRPRPTQPIKDNEVILLHQQFSHPMDRAVPQLRLFLVYWWMDGWMDAGFQGFHSKIIFPLSSRILFRG